MVSERSRVRQRPERAVPDQADAILAQGLVAHVAFSQDEQPYVIPMSYYFDPARPDRLYLHGSPVGRLLGVLRAGLPLCIAVTIVEGMVASKGARSHSLNYRSVVCFGRARALSNIEAKRTLLQALIARYLPGRTAGEDYVGPSDADLASVEVVEVLLEDKSAKQRYGPPAGPCDRDPSAPGLAGSVPLARRADWRAYLLEGQS